MFFFLALKGYKSRTIPEGKIEIDGKLLDTGKVQFMSHPEVAKWEYEVSRRCRERKLLKSQTPPKMRMEVETRSRWRNLKRRVIE